MEASQKGENGYVSVVEIEINAGQPGRSGFVLQGRGADRADYRLEMHLEIPVDQTTQTVLGGMLAQSEWRILRRTTAPMRRINRPRTRKPVA
jgi:hypothetical protein